MRKNTQITTQEVGIPITSEQMRKLRYLQDLLEDDLAEWLNVDNFPSDRWEAHQVFNKRFAFYDLITIGEYERLSNLRHTFKYLTVDPALLLDPDKYDLTNLQTARYQLEERMTLYDCFQGLMIVSGLPQAGKSCFTAVHTYHGREWFNLRVITYKTPYLTAHGETEYLNDEEFITEVSKVTELIEKKEQEIFRWKTDKDKQEFLSRFDYSQIVVEEAHKVLSRENRTRLSRYWMEFIKEVFHCHCLVILVTQFPDELRDEVLKGCNQRVGTSINVVKNGESDIDICVRDTKDRKPIIYLNRDAYKEIWHSDAPIAMSSNISKKFIDNLERTRKESIAEGKEKEG